MGFFSQVLQGVKNLAQHPLLTFKAAVSREDPYSLRFKKGRKELSKRVAQSILVGGAAVVGGAFGAQALGAGSLAAGVTRAGKAISGVARTRAGTTALAIGTGGLALNIAAGRKVVSGKEIGIAAINPIGYAAGKIIAGAERVGGLTAAEKIILGTGAGAALIGAGIVGVREIGKRIKGKKAQVSSMFPSLPSEQTINGGTGLTNMNPMGSTTALGSEVITKAPTKRRARSRTKQQPLNIRNVNRNDIRVYQRNKNVITRTNKSQRLMVVDQTKSYHHK